MKSEALFHATLALSAAYHHKLSLEKLQLLALYHIGQAIIQVKLTLNNENPVVGDDTILAVVAIAAYEVMFCPALVVYGHLLIADAFWGRILRGIVTPAKCI